MTVTGPGACAIAKLLLAAVAAVCVGPAAQARTPTYAGCSVPSETYARSYYVDPRGQPDAGASATPLAKLADVLSGPHGDGSKAAPFSRLSDALSAARNGDIIYLRSGAYGDVLISGANADFITLAADAGQTPVLTSLKLAGKQATSHWVFRGLTLAGYTPGQPPTWAAHAAKLIVNNSDNIVIEGNVITSYAQPYRWHPIVAGVTDNNALFDGIGSINSSCVSLYNNRISTVFNGIQIGGDQSNLHGQKIVVSSNMIDDFSGDGIDHYASFISIENNTIINGHDICENKCVHNDGIQGWNYNLKPTISNANVLVNGNTIIQETSKDLPLPADALQGITIFDGEWDNVVVTNNVVVVSAWHGISLFGTKNSLIANNTVLSNDPKRSAWIAVGNTKNETMSGLRNVVVRNNIAGSLLTEKSNGIPGISWDHNIVFRDPKALFVAADIQGAHYDLHLRKGSAAIKAGASPLAPTRDIEGRPRIGAIDAGAYAFSPTGSISP